MQNIEQTTDQLVRFEIFEFSGGDYSGDVFRYTTYEKPVVVGGETYDPIFITHTGLDRSVGVSGREVTIQLSPTCDLFSFLFPNLPRRAVHVSIIEGASVEDAPSDIQSLAIDPRTIWKGRVTDVDYSRDRPELKCAPRLSGLDRLGNSGRWQRQCWNTLYQGHCGASKAAATRTVSATLATGTTYNLPSGWNAGTDVSSFIRGTAEWTGPRGLSGREIIDATDTSVTLDTAFIGFSGSQSVSLILGCDRRFETCSTLHNAATSYRGQRKLPKVNPMGKNTHL